MLTERDSRASSDESRGCRSLIGVRKREKRRIQRDSRVAEMNEVDAREGRWSLVVRMRVVEERGLDLLLVGRAMF